MTSSLKLISLSFREFASSIYIKDCRQFSDLTSPSSLFFSAPSMKKLLVTTVALIASVQLSSADLIGSLVGKWKSNSAGPSAELIVDFKRLGKKGFVYKSTLLIPGQPNSTGIVNYKGNGTTRGSVNHGGVIAEVTGTWRIVGKTFTETSVITSRVGVTNTTSRSKLINPRLIRVNSVVNGNSSIGTLSKIR